jgi:glycosyltransferase involved in cell wall biosynthesis
MVEQFQSNPLNAFGAGIFNDVLLDFQPTHVIDIRDSWHFEYQFRSPLRKYFAHVVMPAVDAIPQHKTWLDMYATADKLLSYTDWGIDVLNEAGLKNTHAAASPCSSAEYRPLSEEQKADIKKAIGLGDITVVGTVMRNQRRKLFPELFRDFSRYLRESKRKDVFLLCHTSNPDTWELDELLLEHGVMDRVLFTYVCRNPQCKNIEFSFYRGIFSSCQKCGNGNSSTFTNTQNGIPNEAMNLVYNAMDVYVQYAICEGYGMPLGEAIACGIPVMGVDYSAMSEIIHQSNGYPIKPVGFFKEPETGRMMALPDSHSFLNGLKTYLGMSKSELREKGEFSRMLYGLRSYDDIARIWLDALNNTAPKKPWNAPDVRYNMNIQVPKNASNSEFARFLITQVLQAPEFVGSFMEARLIRDISNGVAPRSFDGKYYHEDISGRGMSLLPFDREVAVKHFGALLEEKQYWEQKRSESLRKNQ